MASGATALSKTASLFVLAAPLLLAGCTTDQSAIHPAGRDARDVANLFWVMTAGGAAIWLGVMGCVVFAVLNKGRPRSEKFADRFILAGGVAFPTVTLALLLVFGLSLLPGWAEEDPPDLSISISGEQFWWRVGYEREGQRIETANEVHLPVGAVAEFVITSPDVIHSFWIPNLGGKMDAIPGRTTVLRLEPDETGVFRGVCAEFCGPSHALMAFDVVVHEPAAFEAWLAEQAVPATGDASAFDAAGCGGCHTVRGLVEEGAVGPDLTHFASRRSMAASTLPITRPTLLAWLTNPEGLKPGVHMPAFVSLPTEEREAIVDFLMGLK